MVEKTSQIGVPRALEQLRADKSGIGASEFAVSLAALIFLRWADFQDAEQEAIAAFDDANYEPILPATLHWRTFHNLPVERLQRVLAHELPDQLTRLGNARHNALATQLHHIAPAVERLSRLPLNVLETATQWLASQPFETPHDRRRLLDTFNTVVFQGMRSGEAAQYRTPAAVARLIVTLANPTAGERIYDPCFGTANLLTAAVDYVQDKLPERHSRGSDPPLHLAGVEINADAYTIGLTRLVLAGIADPQLELGNSLERTPPTNPQSEGFDIVLANPPWGSKVDLRGHDHFPIRTNDSASLFIQHALSQLRPGGRAVIVVPPSVLFGTGSHQQLRQMLLEQHTVEAVVSLPTGVFMPYTSIASNLLVLRREGPTKSISMVEVVRKKDDHGGDAFLMLECEEIAELARRRAPRSLPNAWNIEVSELANIGWDLTPKRRNQSGLLDVLKTLGSEVSISPLKDCCDIFAGRPIPSADLVDSPPSMSSRLDEFPERTALEAELSQLEERHRSLTEKRREQSRRHQRDLESRRAQFEQMKAHRERTVGELRFRDHEVDSLQQRRMELQERLHELAEVQASLEQRRSVQQSIQAELDQLRPDDPAVIHQRERLIARIEETETEIQKLTASTLILEFDRDEPDKLEREQERLLLRRRELTDQLASVDAEHQRLEEQLRSSERQLFESQSRAEAEESDLHARKRELHHRLDDINRLIGEFRRDELMKRESAAIIPFVRIRDVQRGEVAKTSSWLTAEAAKAVESRWKLKAGDILLSKSGTIGKAGIVRNGAVGAIAANGFVVLRVKEGVVDPHYLLAFLQSGECNSWLDERARGSAARHLTMNVIVDLPIPLPQLNLQRRIAEQVHRFGADAVAYMAELFSKDQDDPVATAINGWIESNLGLIEGADEAPVTRFELLEMLAESHHPVNTCKSCGRPYYLDYTTHFLDPPEDYAKGIETTCLSCWLGVGPSSDSMESLRKSSLLVDWAFKFKAALSGLSNITRIPYGLGLLNVLQSVCSRLHDAEDAIKGHLPNEDKARRLTQGLGSFLATECDRLLQKVNLVVSVLSAIEREDGQAEIDLRLSNNGQLPIRELSVTTQPDFGRESIPYLAEQSSCMMRLAGPISTPGNTIALTVSWSGLNLAGEQVSGSREVVVEIVRPQEVSDSQTIELVGSPYVCGDPVKTDRLDLFVGRDELLDQIRRQIMHSGNVVLLEGNRRAGKSTILWHLEGRDAVRGWLGVYCSLQRMEGDNSGCAKGVPTVEFFRGLAQAIAESIQKHLGSVMLPDGSVLPKGKPGVAKAVRPAIHDDAPFSYFREYLEQLLESLQQQNLGLLLLLDEFDKLQDSIKSQITSPQVPENLRFLLQTHPRLSAILTGTKRLKRVREDYFSVLYGLGIPFNVSSISQDAAIRLVVEPVKGQLAFATEAVDRALELTACQPYLLQCLCAAIYRTAQATGFRSVTLDHVNEAARLLVQDSGHFVDLFRSAGTDRRRFIVALCHRESSAANPLRFGVLHEKLLSLGIEVRDEELAVDLEWLTDWELLNFSGGDGDRTYSLTVPLMGQWIDTLDEAALLSKAQAETEDHDE